MSTNNNCQPQAADSPAQAAPQNEALAFLHDCFQNTEMVNQMRSDLRTWFTNNILDWESRFGSRLETQAKHYDLLDEFLSKLISHPISEQTR